MNNFKKAIMISSAVGATAYLKSDKKMKRKIKRDTKRMIKVANGVVDIF